MTDKQPTRVIQFGVVAVVVRENRLLVIRRSQHVRSPGAYCFPGGGIEPGESQREALRRELNEELNVDVRPVQPVWESVTPWGVRLAWWQAELESNVPPHPNPTEVESVHWLTTAEMRALPELLESNHHFLDALARGECSLSGLES